MAFRNMMEADCGGQNPLMKLGGHFSQDQAFRQDRPLNIPSQFSDAECLVNDFLEDQFSQNVQTFRMDALVEEMRDIELFSSRNPINQAPNVAQLASLGADALWSEEFLRAEKLGAANSAEEAFLKDADPPLDIGFERAVTNACAGQNTADVWASEYDAVVPRPADAWVENFLNHRQDELGVIDLANTSESETDSGSKFQKFWQRAEEGEQLAQEMAASTSANPEGIEGYGTEDVEGDWAGVDSQEFWDKMQKMWQQLAGPDSAESESWQSEFSNFVDPYKAYEFEAENPMKNSEDPFEEGLKMLEQQNLPSAVLCFEAAVQADPENARNWQYLGTTQAENEQDPFAIAALRNCLNLQPDNLTALQALAISYTNENYQNQACQMLREWLQHNPKYTDLCSAAPPLNRVSSILDDNYHAEVKDLFIKAANRTPVGEIDVDVQCALGVLFNLSNEHDKAVDCFKAALQAVPEDFRMWNRLGATLANGNRSEEAVDAYYHALQLSPGFIRARYNLGITCINLKAYKEAVEHLLTALNLQAKGTTSRGEKGSMSDSIWGTLRLVVSLLGNHELLPAVEARDLPTLNREYSIK